MSNALRRAEEVPLTSGRQGGGILGANRGDSSAPTLTLRMGRVTRLLDPAPLPAPLADEGPQ
jgi:hypothetical protein